MAIDTGPGAASTPPGSRSSLPPGFDPATGMPSGMPTDLSKLAMGQPPGATVPGVVSSTVPIDPSATLPSSTVPGADPAVGSRQASRLGPPVPSGVPTQPPEQALSLDPFSPPAYLFDGRPSPGT